MSRRPRHLIISGNSDCDPYRMSAEERCENYVHVLEVDHVDFVLPPYDIAYLDSSTGWRDGAPVDVRRERLAWCLGQAKSHPRKLFVIVRDLPPPLDPHITMYSLSPGWEALVDEWEGRSLANVFLQDDKWFSERPLKEFLSPAVQAWQSLQEYLGGDM